MKLQIAGLYMDIQCDGSVEAHLPNLQPFVTEIFPEGESIVCTLLTGQTIEEEDTEPTLTSVSDEKTIRLWLKPEACKLSLHISSLGRTFGCSPIANGRKFLPIGSPNLPNCIPIWTISL